MADPKKPKAPIKDDPEQSQRFVETARKLKVDTSGKSFEDALHEIARASKSPEASDLKQPARAKE
jgi:hypothetical protein